MTTSTKPLRVGLDLDDTVTRNDDVWRAHFQAYPCQQEPPHRHVLDTEVSSVYDYWRSICKPCYQVCLESRDILLSHDLMPGVEETLRDLSGRGIEFFVITARWENIRQITLDWLSQCNILPYVKSVTFSEEKRKICEELHLDYLLDDSPRVWEDLMKPTPSSTELLVMRTPYNAHIEHPVVLHDWDDVRRFFESKLALR